eukprot:3479380-Rhodomonas_salina.1
MPSTKILCVVPGNLDFATVQSDMILIFIVLYVYSVLAPITSFVMALGFFLMGVVFKYQVGSM